MAFKKLGEIKVPTIVKGEHVQDTGFIFYSYDKGSAALVFRFIIQGRQVVDLTNTTFKILLTIEQDGQEKKFTAIDSQPIIDHPEIGVVTYPLPDQLLNYEGEVKGYVYLDFEDGSHSDESAFTFTIVRSKIDSEIEEASEIYIKDFEQVKKEIVELAKREKEEIEALRPSLEGSVQQLTEQVQTIGQKVEVTQTEANRLLQLIDENELFTKKELIEAFTKGYFEVSRSLDFKGKVVGSMVENPNIASQVNFISENRFEMPTPYTHYPEVNAYPSAVNAIGYESLRGTRTYSSSSSGPLSYPYMIIQWNVVEEIQRWLGEEYYLGLNAETLAQRVLLVEKGLVSITPSTYGYAYHGTTEDVWSRGQGGMASLWYDNHLEQWKEYQRNPEKRFQTMSASIVKNGNEQFLDSQGRVNILMMGEKGAYASLYYGKTTLQFTYRIYLTDILYYKRDPTIDRMQTQIQQLWNEVFKH
ncbi:TPA: BppU family phage baseplate upper protein [Enterococcus faecium]